MPEVKTILPGYYTTEEAAERLGYASPMSITNMCNTSKIHAYKVKKVWLIPCEVVDDLEKQGINGKGNRGVKRK